jgi:transcriptional regulator with XRE-family HTH domain
MGRTPRQRRTKLTGSLRRPAEEARKRAGLTLNEAARRARITPAYLKRVERLGAAYILARRLARLYACPIDVFLPTKPPKGRSDAH